MDQAASGWYKSIRSAGLKIFRILTNQHVGENSFLFLEERQNIVEILVNNSELRESLLDSFIKRMPDFQKIEWRFIKKKATLQVLHG